MNDTYRTSLLCNNCGYGWLIDIEKGRKVYNHSYGVAIIDDDCYTVDAEAFQKSIICPSCGCKSGVERG